MRIILLLFLIYLPLTSLAQKASVWIQSGDEAMEAGEFYVATQRYAKAWEMDSTDFDLTVKFAQALRLSKRYSEAARLYEKAHEKDLGRIFENGLFWLATMQKYNGNYRESLRNFKRFNRQVRQDRESYEYLKSEQEIESVLFALNARIDSGEVNLNHIAKPTNSVDAEFSPFPGPDSLLFFSRILTGDLNENEKSLTHCLSTEKLNDKFLDPVELDSVINASGFHQANLTFSPDHKKVFFTRCSDPSICKIYQADYSNQSWQNVQEVSSLNVDGFTSTMPFYTEIDGTEVLFFASNRPGGIGKMDIWYSQFQSGSFSSPKNLGEPINSIDSEVTPFYLDGKLYFSSDWHEGFGGFDVFKSEGIPGKMNQPENLGFPFNSSVNDLYYVYSADWQRGYLASNRPGSFHEKGETCCNDLYSFIYTDSLAVDTSEYASLEELNDYLPVTLYFHNDRPNPGTLDTTTTLTYLETYENFRRREENYIAKNTENLTGNAREEKQYEIEEFFSLKVEKGMNDLQTFSELLLEELQSGREVELAVRGFASPRAETNYNENLTKRRISSMVNYLKWYEDGAFLPYFADTARSGGSLSILQVPFGESQADTEVSDRLEDEQSSIYSREASLERKIEVISVQRDITDSTEKYLQINVDTLSLGNIPAIDTTEFTFSVFNSGTENVQIDSVIFDCESLKLISSPKLIFSADSGEFEFSIFPTETSDQLIFSDIIIYSDAANNPVRFTLSAVRRQD